jgi:hypothetical protein
MIIVITFLVFDNTDVTDTVLPQEQATALSLGGGSDGSTVAASDIAGEEASGTGWYAFINPDNIDVRILLGGGFLSTHTAADIVTIHNAIKAVYWSMQVFGGYGYAKEYDIEINSAQGRIMFVLWQQDSMSINELASKTQLKKST